MSGLRERHDAAMGKEDPRREPDRLTLEEILTQISTDAISLREAFNKLENWTHDRGSAEDMVALGTDVSTMAGIIHNGRNMCQALDFTVQHNADVLSGKPQESAQSSQD